MITPTEVYIQCDWSLPKSQPWWKRAWTRFVHLMRYRTWYTLEERLEIEFAKQIQAEIDQEIINELLELTKEQK